MQSVANVPGCVSRQDRVGSPSMIAAAGPRSATPRAVWRTSEVSAAACAPLPLTSPIIAVQVLAGLEEVVEVAAHLEALGARRVDGGRLDSRDLRQARRQERLLQGASPSRAGPRPRRSATSRSSAQHLLAPPGEREQRGGERGEQDADARRPRARGRTAGLLDVVDPHGPVAAEDVDRHRLAALAGSCPATISGVSPSVIATSTPRRPAAPSISAWIARGRDRRRRAPRRGPAGAAGRCSIRAPGV